MGWKRQNGRLILSDAFFCSFRAVCVQPGHYPADLARRFRPFVDLLLTRRLDSKKPRLVAGRKALILLRILVAGAGFEPAAFRL